jgi:uncharacterized protein
LKLLNNLILISVLLGLLTGPVSAQSLAIPEHPVGRVNDFAHLFSVNTLGQLNELIGSYQAKTGKQIVIATFPSIAGGGLAAAATDIYTQWGIGQDTQQRGVLIVIFRKEHLVKIEVGSGLEKDLPQDLCSEVIRQNIIPDFKKGNYDTGMVEAVTVLTGLLEERTGGVVAHGKRLSARATMVLVTLLVSIGVLVLVMIILKYASSQVLGSEGISPSRINTVPAGLPAAGSEGGWYNEDKRRGTLPGKFFTETEVAELSGAICQAEERLNGRIVIFLERDISVPVLERAQMVLAGLNAAAPGREPDRLIYLVVKNKLFALTGKTAPGDKLRDILQDYFNRAEYVDGLKKILTEL